MFTINFFSILLFFALIALGFVARSRGYGKVSFLPFKLWFGLQTLWTIVVLSVGMRTFAYSKEPAQFYLSVERLLMLLGVAGVGALLLMWFIPAPRKTSVPPDRDLVA
jgi:hypothetical protein